MMLKVGWFDCFGFYRPLFQYRWSGGAKMLGKLSVPGRPTNLDNSRTMVHCACSRCRWGLF